MADKAEKPDTYIWNIRIRQELREAGFSREDASKVTNWLRNKDYVVVSRAFDNSRSKMDRGIRDLLKHLKDFAD